MIYNYENIVNSPDFVQIKLDIDNSAMTDKNVIGFRWDEDTEILKIEWNEELSEGDKTILDNIISNYE